MKHTKIEKLIAHAKDTMNESTDPIHGLSHVERVVVSVKNICTDMNIQGQQKDALILATYWHDISRTITKYPSVVWMIFLDDLISAFILLKSCCRIWSFGYVQNTAIKIIFCKSIGTGKILTKLLLRKKDRVLLDILKDADMLDVVHVERVQNMMPLGDLSKIYLFGYKKLIDYNLKPKHVKFKTRVAIQQFEESIKQLIDFLQKPEVLSWHIKQFGKEWCDNIEKKLYEVLDFVILLNLKTC